MSPPSVGLPVELIEEILSKSPVKSVLRFKSVTKQWHAIISDPRFSRIHRIQRSKLSENQNTFAVWKRTPRSAGLCISLMRLEEDGRKLTTVSEFHHQYYSSILCSCNGIFLLTDGNHGYNLWNPYIRKSTEIMITAGIPCPSMCNFYYDERSDDYKIVFVCGDKYTVYSCKNRSWGEMLYFPCSHIRYLGATVDGCVYALCNGEVVFFDFRDGKLGKFPRPNVEDEFGCSVYLDYELQELSGRLCLCVHATTLRIYEIYVMEKNGSFENIRWRKVISIVKEEGYTYDWFLQLVGLINEDYVVRGRSRSDFIWIHNLSEKRLQKIEFDWSGVTKFSKYEENVYMPC